jgi:hypothetical protein
MDYHEQELERRRQAAKENALRVAFPDRYKESHDISTKNVDASKHVIEMSGKIGGTLFDPCAGWGGRMLGAAAAGWDYYSCDPNKETFDNLQRLIRFIQPKTVTSIQNMPVEDFDLNSIKHVDIVLASPPYFNLEVYNHTPEQSYNKHSTYAEWRDAWLIPLINRCLDKLEAGGDNGISAWNVMNFGKNDFSGDTIKAHTDRGWQLVDTVGFNSPLANIRNLKNKDVTYIFKKLN